MKKAIILFLSLIPLAGTGQDEDSLVISSIFKESAAIASLLYLIDKFDH